MTRAETLVVACGLGSHWPASSGERGSGGAGSGPARPGARRALGQARAGGSDSDSGQSRPDQAWSAAPGVTAVGLVGPVVVIRFAA